MLFKVKIDQPLNPNHKQRLRHYPIVIDVDAVDKFGAFEQATEQCISDEERVTAIQDQSGELVYSFNHGFAPYTPRRK